MYDPSDNASKSYNVAIEALRERLEKSKVVIGDCVLYCERAEFIVPTLAKVDALVTDPPYGIGISSNPVRQKHERKDWDNTPVDKGLLDNLLKISSYQIIWGGNYFDLPPHQCFLVWDKVQPENFSLAMCEQAWTNFKRPAKLFRRHVVSFDKHHPTQKPIELMKWCIGHLPDDAETILDPFMGSGSTLVSAVKMGKRGIGIEKDPKYFEIACRRIEEAYKQPDLFVPSPSAKPEQLDMEEALTRAGEVV